MNAFYDAKIFIIQSYIMTEILNNNIEKKTFRFKFNKEIMELLTYFSKLHYYDTREDYKEAWKKWYECNNDILEREGQRIINLGYTGNVEDKMYKAARYYFRKTGDAIITKETIKGDCLSTLNNDSLDGINGINGINGLDGIEGLEGLDITPVKKRRQYISLSRDILDTMDNHIKTNINNNNYTPAIGFADFCKNNIVIIATETITLKNNNDLDKIYISSKIKKTYKNRYYIIAETTKQ